MTEIEKDRFYRDIYGPLYTLLHDSEAKAREAAAISAFNEGRLKAIRDLKRDILHLLREALND